MISLFRLLPLALLSVTAVVPVASAAGAGDVETAIKTSFNYRMVLRSHVDVRVSDDVATLSGRAEDETTRMLAEETALAHPGVRRVVNRIEVKPWLSEFSDGWMARHIELLLMVKAEVNPETTQVVVRNGVATLTGTAETAGQKALTVRYAQQIVGVKSVVDRIEVSTAAVARRFWDGPIDDASITSQLRHAIRQTPEIQPRSITLSTLDGAVLIVGVARTEAEKAHITQLAREVRGASSVTNQLTVAETLTDAERAVPVPLQREGDSRLDG